MSPFVVTNVSLPYSSDGLATTLKNFIWISVWVFFKCFLIVPHIPWNPHLQPTNTQATPVHCVQFCSPHKSSLHRRNPPVLPHMQQIKVQFSNCFI
jgi:hypothetical protein